MFSKLPSSLSQNCIVVILFNFFTFVFIFHSILYSQARSPTPPMDVAKLEPGQPIVRKISGNLETQNFQISLTKDQYAKITIDQAEVDISANLYGTDGKLVDYFNNELRLKSDEIIEFVAPQPGIYRLEIKTGSKAWEGNYKITLVKVSEANEIDRAVNEGQELFKEGEDAKNADKYNQAVAFYKHALEIAEKYPVRTTILTARVLNGLSHANINGGNYPEARKWLDRAADFNTKTFGANNPLTIRTVFLLGQYYSETDDNLGADRSYRQALAAYEVVLGKEHPVIFNTLLELSSIYSVLADWDTVVAYLQRAQKIVEINYGENHRMLAGVYNNIGNVYLQKGDYDSAERSYIKTIEIGEKAGESNRYTYSYTLQNLGLISYKKKNYPKALEFYERTLKMRETSLGKDHRDVGFVLLNMAAVYQKMGDPGKSLEILQRAREIAEKGLGLYDNLAMASIGSAAEIFASQGEIEKAVEYRKIFEERFEKLVAINLSIGSERQKLQFSKQLEKSNSDTISMHLSSAQSNQMALDLAALTVIRHKGRVLDAVADNMSALRSRSNEIDRALLDRFNQTNSQLAKLTLTKPGKTTDSEYEKELSDLEAQKERIEVEIGDRNGGFPVQGSVVTLPLVMAEIPENAALIEFAAYNPLNFRSKDPDERSGEVHYVAYILRKNAPVRYAELGDRKAIDKAIDDLRQALTDPKRSDIKQLARAADAKIMQPIRALTGNATQLLLSPDGALNLIPFEALVDEKNRYLIENYSFNYLTSGRDLLRMRATRESKSRSLLIANPEFGKTTADETSAVVDKPRKTSTAKRRSVTATRSLSDTYFAPLTGTTREAREIQTLFPDAALLSGAEATETALKQVTAPRILHIATHGFFLEDESARDDKPETAKPGAKPAATTGATPVPALKKDSEYQNPLLRSGLAFAGANRRWTDNGDDGILTALEASGLNLWGTKLVVLSACDTGLGEVKNGEGVYGLRRAFTLAGAETLMMSLWAVSDYSTRELMTNYYKNLKAGMGRGESLRRVQLDMLKTKGREHPFYWAPFIQTGEWANLDGKR